MTAPHTVVLVAAAWLSGCSASRPPAAPPVAAPTPRTARAAPTRETPSIEQSPHLALGTPKDGDPSDDTLMDKGVYVVSYNAKINDPNGVAWRLTGAEVGDSDRSDDFRADADLPAGLYRVVPGDYTGSGYDRGHMCPSAQRTATKAMNSLTFLMTNMQPQLHALN